MKSWTYFIFILFSFFLGACSRNPLGEDLKQPILNLTFSLNQICTNNLNQDATYSCQINTSEVIPNNIFSLDALLTTCPWASIDPVTGIVSGTPNDNNVGTCQIVVTAQNTQRRAIPYGYAVQVVNLPATFSISNANAISEDSSAAVIRADADVQASEEGFGSYSFDHLAATVPRCSDNSISLTINAATGAVTYQPAANFFGNCYVRVNFDDGNGAGNSVVSAQFLVPVNGINDAPTIGPIANQTTNVNTPINVNFNVDDTDNVLTCSALNLSATSSNNAVVTNAAITFSGTIPNCVASITPVAAALGTTTINIVASDGTLTANTSFNLNVIVIPQPPVLAVIPNQNGFEDTPLVFTINITDPDTVLACNSTYLSATSTNTSLLPNANILFSGLPPNCTVTLNSSTDISGVSNVTINLTDGGFVVSRTFQASFAAVNDAPVINPILAQVTSEDQTIAVNFTINDVDNTLTCGSSVSMNSTNAGLVANASVVYSGSAPNCTATITPTANQNGSTDITFTVTDGALIDAEVFTLTVNPVNDAPTMNPILAQVTSEDQSIAVSFTVNDVDNTLNCGTSVNMVSTNTGLVPNAAVVFSGVAPNCMATITPTANQNGSTDITLTVADSGVPNLQAARTFTLTINPVNDAPTMDPILAQATSEDQSIAVNFTVNDVDNTLNCGTSVTMVSTNTGLVPNASVVYSGSAPNCTATITPSVNQNGSADITLTVADGGVPNLQAARTFTLTVNAVNDAPVMDPIFAQATSEDQSIAVNFTVNDVDNTLNCGTSVSMISTNSSLVANASVVYSGSTPNCTATITPTANQNGSTDITLTVNDGGVPNLQHARTFTLTVNQVNDAPVMNPIISQVTSEDQSIVINFTISDIDNTLNCGTSVSMISTNIGLVANASVVYSGSAPNCTATITPTTNQNGSTDITLTVNDVGVPNLQDARTFTLLVNPVNDAPVVAPILAQSTNENTPLAVNFTVNDVDNILFCSAISITASSDNSALVLNTNIVITGSIPNCTATITPVASINGIANITLTAFDTGVPVLQDTEVFVLTVTPYNDPPVINPIIAQVTSEDQSVAVNFTINDVDNILNCVTSVSMISTNTGLVANAAVVISGAAPNCTATISPTANQNGSTDITLTVSDGNSTDLTLFSLTVNPVNDAPTINPILAQATSEDQSIAVNFTINDIDNTLNCGSSVSMTSTNISLVANAAVVFSGAAPNCTATITPTANQNGSTDITLTVNDGGVPNLQAVRTFNLVVNSTNDAPTMNPIIAQATSEDQSIAVNFTINDIDSTLNCGTSVSMTSANTGLVANAAVVFSGAAPNCTATITPTANQNGSTDITLTVNDGGVPNLQAARTFNLVVNSTNDAPTMNPIIAQATSEDQSIAVNFTINDIDSTLNCGSSVSMVSTNTGLVANASVVYSGSAPNCTATITPTANQNGSTDITLTVNDGEVPNLQAARTFTLTVNAINDAPVIDPIIAQATSEDQSVAVNFTINDVDSTLNCGSSVLMVSTNTGLVANASVVYSGAAPNCTATITPTANQNGSTDITLTVSDGALTDAEVFTLTVNAVNDAPTMNPILAQATSEDQSVAVNFTINDIDSTLNCGSSVSMVSTNTGLVANASVVYSGSAPNCTATITPTANQNGSTDITLTVSDGALTDAEVFTLTVNAVNDAPTMNPILAQATSEDQSIAVNFTINDIDSTLNCGSSVSMVSTNTGLVANASVVYSGSAPNCTATITPTANQNGSTDITLTVSDGALTDAEVFTLTVNAVNDAPTMNPILAQATSEDQSIAVNFTINDIDNTLTCGTSVSMSSTNTGLVANAAVVYSGAAPNCTATITPTANQNGSTDITLTVSDGSLTDAEVFTLTVNPVNDAPAMTSILTQNTTENVARLVSFDITDIDNTLNCSALNLSYSSTNTALIDTGDIIFSGSAPNCIATITPKNNQNGVTNLTFTVSDNGTPNLQASRIFILNVTPYNDPPVIAPIISQVTSEDQSIAVNFTINDIDNTLNCGTSVSMSSTNTGLVANASVLYSGSAPNCTATITPTANQNGSTDITLTVTDGTSTDAAVFRLTVSAVNDAPTMNPILAQTSSEDQSIAVNFTINDIDNTLNCGSSVAMTSTNTGLVANASVVYSGSAPNCTATITPTANQNGSTDITLTVDDGGVPNLQAARTFRLTVTAINDPPVIDPILAQATSEDQSIAVSFTINDPDNTLNCGTSVSMSSTNTGLVANASVVYSGSAPNCTATITPTANQNGSTDLTLTVTDGTTTDAALFTLTVAPVNDAPTMNPILAQVTSEDLSIAVNFTINDVDNTLNCGSSVAMTSTNTGLVANASVVYGGSAPNCTATITPAANQSGSTDITLTVSDGGVPNLQAARTFTLTVNSVNDAPTISAIVAQATSEDQSIAVNFTINDVDNTLNCGTSVGMISTVPGLVANTSVVFSGSAPACTATITPTLDQFGLTNITLTVNDGGTPNMQATSSFNLTVAPVNDAPVMAVIANQTMSEDGSLPVAVNVTDVDNTLNCTTSLSFSSSNAGLVGLGNIIFSGTAPNCVATINPAANLFGSANLTIRVSDTEPLHADRTFTLTVNSVNDAPTISNITDQNINEDTVTSAIPFMIGDIDTTILCNSSNVSVSSSNIALIPNSNVVIGGAYPNCTITSTPLPNQNGTSTITVTVNDNDAPNLQAVDTFVLTVNAVNDAPTISTIINQTVNEDTSSGSLGFTIGDIETGGSLSCAGSVSVSSSNTTVIPISGLVVTGTAPNCSLVITPAANQFANNINITVRVTDTGLPLPVLFTDMTFVVDVPNVNDAPVLSAISDITINQNTASPVLFTINDIDSTLNCTTSMSAVSSNTTVIPTGNIVFSGTAPNCTATITSGFEQSGIVNLTFTVTDSAAATHSRSFNVTVNAVDDPPIISGIANQTKFEDNSVTATYTATPFNVNFTISDSETSLACNSTFLAGTSSNSAIVTNPNITFSGTAPNCVATILLVNNAVGTTTITIAVNDGVNTTNTNFTVTTTQVNDPPTITAIPAQVTNKNTPLVINFTISDLEENVTCALSPGGSLTRATTSSTKLPVANIVFGGTAPNCTVTLTPAANQIGTVAGVTIRVSDGVNPSVPTTFSLFINNPPVITIDASSGTSFPVGVASPIDFTITDDGPLDCTTSMTAVSSNQAVVPNGNIVFSGSAPSCIATVTATSIGSTTITYTVTDIYSAATSAGGSFSGLTSGSNVVSTTLSTMTATVNASLNKNNVFAIANEPVTFTVTVKDTDDNNYVGNHWVVIQKGNGTSDGVLSAVTDNHDGTYTATFNGNVTGAAREFKLYINGYEVTSVMPKVTVSQYGPNCLSYRSVGYSADGVYALDSDGDFGLSSPYNAYCDMTSQGGGWTLVAVPRKGIAPFAEFSGLLSPSDLGPSRNNQIWKANSQFEFTKIKVTDNQSDFSTAQFGATQTLQQLLTTYSSYSQSNVVLGSTVGNTQVSSTIGSTCFIVRGKSDNVASWTDSADYLFMGFHSGSACAKPITSGNSWDRMNTSAQWLISGFDGLDAADGPEQSNSNVGRNNTNSDWSNQDTTTLIWMK